MNDLLGADSAKARWQRVRDLFDELADLDADSRHARLQTACGGDVALRRDVEALLTHDHTPDDPIDRVVVAAACEVLPAGERDASLAVPSTFKQYLIVERLGEGGMGEVFLAEDATLGRRVALKLPSADVARDPTSRARLMGEARAAATLSHPHVCVVHEVGEAPDGRPFIAMEYLAGETLSARLSRGPLTPEDVLTLGVDASSALAAAHTQGVVHRDLKPANIMLTAHGSKLLDFGLASSGREGGRDGASFGQGGGTVPYMSPEQARGEVVDHRSDIFSLGLVLYEAATGRKPFEPTVRSGSEGPARHRRLVPPSAHAEGLPAGFDAVVTRTLAVEPLDRYQRASDLGADLVQLRTRLQARQRPTRIVRAGAVAVLVLLAVLAGVALRSRTVPSPPESTPATVLIGEIANATGDSAFAGILREALAVHLQQTPFIRVVPTAGIHETLRQMGRTADEPLTPGVAQELARRRGLHAWVSGSLSIEDGRHVVRLVASNGSSGDVIARGEADAADRSGVLAALGRSVVQLRHELGESRRTLQQFNTPLEQATTASLDALRAYALGVQQTNRGEYALAMSLFQRAVEIDPEFALAYQALASQSLNSGYLARVEPNATRAYELRSRVTEQEQYRIVYFYHLSVTGDLAEGIDNARRWRARYPDDWRAHHALSNLYFSLGDHDNGAISGRTAVRLNPDHASSYSNLGGALFALDRFDEARKVYQDASARGFDTPEYHAFLWRIAYYAGDQAAMRQHLDWATTSATWARHMPALAATLQGQWRTAREVSARSTDYFEARQVHGLSALVARYDAVAAALFRDCATARHEAARVIALASQPEEHARALLALAHCGEGARVLADAKALGTRHPRDTILTHLWLPLIDAAGAEARGDWRAALDALRGAEAHASAGESWPQYLRALSLVRARDWAGARLQFEQIIAQRGRSFWVPIVPLAHLGRARAAAGAGDIETAAQAYADLFALWRDADADLPVMVEGRREFAALPVR